eukprot:CAMPEP_0197443258 /NCGR_PEP_ID=MMETSP1175-20131217/9039_1 /TAXON_ID=1003142 /ORGANISM="Triceratium dubium, Strain CCMP147" /LENGTH=34 /DNA_ID= /DNA_START= /DNA_END= /DNA_ORIENTATION=
MGRMAMKGKRERCQERETEKGGRQYGEEEEMQWD